MIYIPNFIIVEKTWNLYVLFYFSLRLVSGYKTKQDILPEFFLKFYFSVSDIGDIPEAIRECQSLQVVDFSSNPIPR